jgi:predicted ATPase
MIVPVDASGGWRFCHPLIHDAAYAGLLATDRKALHARVADRLESRSPVGPLGAIARHRGEAGDAVRAVPLLIRAAESAVVLGARAEAAAYLDMAVGLESGGPAHDELEHRLTELRSMVEEPFPEVPTGLRAQQSTDVASVDGVLAD